MRDNTLILLFAEGGLLAIALAGMAFGYEDLAHVAAGAFVGVLGGHLNGVQRGSA